MIMNKLKYILLFFITITLSQRTFPNHFIRPTTSIPPGYRVKTIVIDAGHGGHDGATKGKFSRATDVAFEIALKLGKAIGQELTEFKVLNTRE